MHDLLCTDPAEAHGAKAVPGGLQPVRQRRIAVCQNQRHAAARVELDTVFVVVDAVITIVERFHPVVIDLQIPEIACRDVVKFDEQRLVGFQLPVAVIIKNVRITARRLTDGLVGRRQRIPLLRLVALRPVGEDARGVFNEITGTLEILVEGQRIKRGGESSRLPEAAPVCWRRSMVICAGCSVARSRKVWRTSNWLLSAVIASQLPDFFF